MKSETPLHIRFELNEALSSRGSFIKNQIDIKRILNAISRYDQLREEESSLRTKIERKITETSANIARLEKDLPKVRIPKILEKQERLAKKEASQFKSIKLEKVEEFKVKGDDSLEKQLEEINRKLKELQQ